MKYRFLLQLFSQSEDRLWLVTPYFSPTGSMLRAIKTAARRGVDVRLIVPLKSDVFFFPWLMASYFEELKAAGVRVYQYEPGFLHAKAMICDNEYMVGSSNLNHRSILHDLELDILLRRPATHAELDAQIQRLMQQSSELTSDTRHHPGYLGFIPRLLRYWM